MAPRGFALRKSGFLSHPVNSQISAITSPWWESAAGCESPVSYTQPHASISSSGQLSEQAFQLGVFPNPDALHICFLQRVNCISCSGHYNLFPWIIDPRTLAQCLAEGTSMNPAAWDKIQLLRRVGSRLRGRVTPFACAAHSFIPQIFTPALGRGLVCCLPVTCRLAKNSLFKEAHWYGVVGSRLWQMTQKTWLFSLSSSDLIKDTEGQKISQKS